MSFGGQSNTPWQRNLMPINQFQNVAPQQMYMQNYNQMPSGNQVYGNVGGNVSNAYPQTYNSIGTVTKINNDCGLVNDEVFFYRNVCKGAPPKLGDRVLFEATQSTTGQFKWNATRIQSMAPQPLMANPIGSLNDTKSSNRYGTEYRGSHHSPTRDRPYRAERREPEREQRVRRSRDREDTAKMAERDRKRRREEVDRSREVERPGKERRDRDISNERKERERKERMRERDREHEREREKDPKGSRTTAGSRIMRRYKVQIPKHAFVCHELTIPDIRQRYSSLYIPSLFFHAEVLWPQSFTFEKPFSLRRASQFHIMHESVEPLVPFKKEELEPNDIDYSYSAKVILLDCPSLAEIYEKCFKDDDEENITHLSSLIRFLFGVRGDNSPMAIGGYWSPSLDGANPGKDPAVLIRTAIRTCKSLTGIDLSNCTQWYRFCEYHYENEKNSSEPARVETVVIFLPDVHSCMPTVEEWQKLTKCYKTAAETLIAKREQLVSAAANNSKTSIDCIETEEQTDISTTQDDAMATTSAEPDIDNMDTGADTSSDLTANNTAAAVAAADISTDGEHIENEKDNEKNEPTHYSKLDLKSMKVQEMRDELIARNLPAKGNRTVIMARLAKAINTEKAQDIQAQKDARQNAKSAARKEQLNSTPKTLAPPKAPPKSPQKITKKSANDDVNMKTGNEKPKTNNDAPKAEVPPQDSKNAEILASEKKREDQDQEETGGGADVDMNDLVILDEYDSRKNPEETPVKELSEKEKERIMRRYTLPSSPHIIVHPNKAAKNGKFDCLLTSLETMLEYGPGDSKQRFFEVALFSELFKEMLMRDFSFNIYKELYIYNQSKGNEQQNNELESKEENSSNNNIDDKNDDKSSKDNNNGDGKSETVVQSVKSSTKRKAANDEKDKESAKEKKHMLTVKPHLLLSFLFFDSTHCGYIYKRDLEEIFYLCGLSLSRAQIHNFLDKLARINAFHYRQITDREGKPDEQPTIEDIDHIDEDIFKKISLGNFALFEENNDESENDGPTEETQDGLVNYNGTVVHVGKLVDQIKRTEKSFSDIEKLYSDLRKEHVELQRSQTKTNIKLKDLQSTVKSLSNKLADTDRELISVNRKYRDEHSALTLVYNRLAPFVGREKEREHRSQSSRKDKDKHKAKDDIQTEKKCDKNKDNSSSKHTHEGKEYQEKDLKKNGGESEQKSEMPTDENHEENSNGQTDGQNSINDNTALNDEEKNEADNNDEDNNDEDNNDEDNNDEDNNDEDNNMEENDDEGNFDEHNNEEENDDDDDVVEIKDDDDD